MKHIALLVLALALPTVHAAPEVAPSQLIDRLGLAIRKVLEDPKSVTPIDVERAVAGRIMALIAISPDHPSLTEADAEGRTPLMLAASDGYAEVVEALLASPKVRQTIDQRDVAGETAWMKASFAPSLTLVACQPGTLTRQRYALLQPYLRRAGHLMKTQGAAIDATVRVLEAAGARADPEAAKLAWLARCPNASPELRQALADGPLTRTLVSHAVAQQGAFNKAMFIGVLAEPPEGMKFVRDGVARQRVERQTGQNPIEGIRCLAMRRPEIPLLNWVGEMTFNVVVHTRAGMVEVVDFEGDVRPKEKAVANALRSAILEALRDYRCQGDHVFEQRFDFKFE